MARRRWAMVLEIGAFEFRENGGCNPGNSGTGGSCALSGAGNAGASLRESRSGIESGHLLGLEAADTAGAGRNPHRKNPESGETDFPGKPPR